MSTTTIPKRIPKPITDRLRNFRRQILQFMFVDGISRVLTVIVMIILVDLAIDRFFKMDQAQRLIMLCVMIAIVVAVLFLRLIRPLLYRPNDDALILQVEERNDELQESLISSVQFSRDFDTTRHGVSDTMVAATIEHGSEMAKQVDFGNTIDRGAYARNFVLLIAGILSIGAIGYGVATTDFWRTWFNRNILLGTDEWPKKTRLTIVGVENNQITLPRGEDHKQFVVVDEESEVTDVDVEIEFDDGNSRTTQKMRRTGKLDDREHLLVFRNLNTAFRFRAKGGDDVTPWVQINLVEPPGWATLDLTASLPSYTGIATETFPQGSGPHAVLEGSSLKITGTANKDLGEAILHAQDRTWDLLKLDGRNYELEIPAEQLVSGKYTFQLADTNGLRSSRPTTFTLKTKPDRAPQVRASLLGISGLVVPRARIPVSFNVTDEYAIVDLQFAHNWNSQVGNQQVTEGTTSLAGVTDQLPSNQFTEIRTFLDQAIIDELNEVQPDPSSLRVLIQVMDLEPLEIPVGTSLRLAVRATDNNTLTGPGIGQNPEFLLRVVSDQELRADLLRREIEQRKAFELALKNQEELTVEVRAMAAALSNLSVEDPDATLNQLLSWQRRQKLIGTNIAGIADRFEDFLIEVKNNRLDEAESEIDQGRSLERRFIEQIIDPIRNLDQYQIIGAAGQLELCSRSIDTPANLRSGLQDAADTQDNIVVVMRQILAAMEDSETYQEVVNGVIAIKNDEERIRKMTQEEKNKAGEEDIFDK